jgi:hypothetical protein
LTPCQGFDRFCGLVLIDFVWKVFRHRGGRCKGFWSSWMGLSLNIVKDGFWWSFLFLFFDLGCFEEGGSFVVVVITPFLPPGFSRVSARKTRQPEPSRSDPTKALRIKYSQEEGPRHISQGLAKFD